MNDTTQSTALTIPQRAAVALGSAEHEQKLLALVEHAKGVTAITNPTTYAECHGARMSLKNARIAIEKAGKAAREDAVLYSKGIIAEEKRLIGLGQSEETRLAIMQEEHDNRVAAEKAAKEQAERARVERIQAEIEEIKAADAGLIVTESPDLIEATLHRAQDTAIDERFQEFKPLAELAKVQLVGRLTKLHAAAREYQTERKRAEEERAELARMKEAEDRRQKEAAEKEAAEIRARAEADATRRAEIDAEERAARQRIEAQERAAAEARAKADRDARDALQAEQAESRARQEAEDERLREERERIAALTASLEEAKRKVRDEEEAKARTQREEKDRAEREARAKADAEERAAAAKAREEQEAREAEQREKDRQAMIMSDACGLLELFVNRYGDIKKFSKVVKAIKECLKPKNGAPAQKTAATQESHAERPATGDSEIMQSPAPAAAPANPDKPGECPFPPQTTTTTEAQ